MSKLNAVPASGRRASRDKCCNRRAVRWFNSEEHASDPVRGGKSRAADHRQSRAEHRKSLTPVTAAGSRCHVGLIPTRDTSQLQPVHQCNPTSNTPSQFGQQENLCFNFIYKISTLCQLFWSTRLIKQLEYYCASPFQFMIRMKSWRSRGRCVFVYCRLRGLTLYKAWGWQTY